MPLKTVQAKKLDPTRLITHRFKLDQILEAYDTFGRAAATQAWKRTPSGNTGTADADRVAGARFGATLTPEIDPRQNNRGERP